MEILLRLKHWQVLILTFGPTTIAFCVVTVLGIKGTLDVILVSRITALIALVPLNFINAWVYMIATTFHQKLPRKVTININSFKISFWYVVIYEALILLLLPMLSLDEGPIILLTTIIFSFCSVYVLYITAKIFQSAERQKRLVFGEFSGDFFAFILGPIGVWLLQPRINNLFDHTLAEVDLDAPLDHGIR